MGLETLCKMLNFLRDFASLKEVSGGGWRASHLVFAALGGKKVWGKVKKIALTKKKKKNSYKTVLKSDREAGDRAD